MASTVRYRLIHARAYLRVKPIELKRYERARREHLITEELLGQVAFFHRIAPVSVRHDTLVL
jgi:hypothetical protein